MESEDTRRSNSESSVPVLDPVVSGTEAESKEEEGGDDENSTFIHSRKEETAPFERQKEILKALEVVERDSVAIAESYTSLFSSLRLALSQATSMSIDHMNCFSDAAGSLQECVLDAATKGNRYINSCLRLNEEMKGIESLTTQLKILRRNVDLLETEVNRLVTFP